MNTFAAWGLGLILAVTSCTEIQECDLLIEHAQIVDILNDSSYAVEQIAIKNGEILYAGKAKHFRSNRQFDAKGRFIMPGLWDMHVHFRGGDSLIGENEDMLPLFLRYGITTVRDAGGDLSPAVLKWKQDIADHRMDGPQIFTSGPKLDGPQPAWPGSISISEDSDIKTALDSLEQLHVDYVKIYDGSLSAEHYYAIIEEATARGYKTTGHMPMSAYLRKGVAAGLSACEHMSYVAKACSPLEDSLTQLNKGYAVLKDIYTTYDEAYALEFFKELAAKEFYVTPTLHISKTLGELAEADHSHDALLKEMGPGIITTYQRRIVNAVRAKAIGSSRRMDGLELSMQMIRPMYDAGIRLLAGSDCGAFNSYVYPGEGLHSELALLVASGLSPAEALSTSVIQGPRFFDLLDHYGSVAAGKRAELVLLEENPLKNIDNLATITYIVNQNKLRSTSE